MRSAYLGIAAVLCVSCSTSEQTGTIALITGDATNVFTQSPAPTTLELDSIGTDGTITTLVQGNLTAGATLTLPDQNTSAAGYLRFVAKDDTGTPRVFGESIAFDFGLIGGLTYDLFVQRTGTLAALPGALAESRTQGLATIVSDEYLFIAGGGNAASDIYDLLSWYPDSSPPTLPRTPLSMASLGTAILLIDASGASFYDLSDSSSADATVPSGGALSEIVGGLTVIGDDGSSYIVGATRATGATSTVLKMATDGTLSFAHLTAARVGAAATWIDGRGLFVAGGSATAAGAEILSADDTMGTPLAFAADTTTGAAAALIDSSHVILTGGSSAGAAAATRSIDVGCGTSCAATTWSAPFPIALSDTTAFAVDDATLFVVGDDAAGASHAYRVTTSASTEVPFAASRNGARAFALPNGGIAVFGGGTTVEQFTP